MEKIKLIVDDLSAGNRVDVFLAEKTQKTRSHIKQFSDFIFVNGSTAKVNKIVKVGDIVEITFPDSVKLDLEPKDIPIDIVYEDQDIAVINKPQGMTVHPGNGTNGDTLVNALLFKMSNLSAINGVERPGIVHRIDKNTSGLLVVAKNDNAHVQLSKQLENKTCKRIYVALLEGVLKEDSGEIKTFISRNPNDRKKMMVSKSGRLAITDYKVLKRYENFTLCEFSLKTGRTHQIRVHANYIHHPVVGDKEYGYKTQKFKLNGQLLHAKTLSFVHPSTGKTMTFSVDLPDYFQEILHRIK